MSDSSNNSSFFSDKCDAAMNSSLLSSPSDDSLAGNRLTTVSNRIRSIEYGLNEACNSICEDNDSFNLAPEDQIIFKRCCLAIAKLRNNSYEFPEGPTGYQGTEQLTKEMRLSQNRQDEDRPIKGVLTRNTRNDDRASALDM